MRRWAVGISVSVVVVLVLSSGVAWAITNGSPDGQRHPYVGLVALYSNGVYKGRCSGALVSPTVVVTAAHCFSEQNATSARVYFDSVVKDDLDAGTGGTAGSVHIFPGFDDFATLPDTHDLGVVVLEAPVDLDRYASLAPVGALDSADRGRLDAVGYGIQQFKPFVIQEKIRMYATPTIAPLNLKGAGDFIVATTSRANNGGGICFGDSGGPMLLPGTDQITAVVSLLQTRVCKGFDYSYRVDTLEAHEFIEGFLGHSSPALDTRRPAPAITVARSRGVSPQRPSNGAHRNR